MAGSRALPDLVARIRVDSSGVDQAIGQLIGSFGKADLALAGVAAGIGLLVVGGKSMIDIAEKHEAAERGLEQAYAANSTKLGAYRDQIQQFIDSNRRYISDQSEVLDGYAKLTRSGLNQTEVQLDMNRALDLASLKHITLSEAVQILDQAEHGRLKGLSDLGITTAKYTDSQGELIASSHDVGRAMQELDQKTAGGRETLTETQQIANRLSNDWQDLAQKGGPPLLQMLDQVLIKADDAFTALQKVGNDPHSFDGLNNALVGAATFIRTKLINPLHEAYDWLYRLENSGDTPPDQELGPAQFAPGTSSFGKGGRASGGPVVPGGVYTVGENGPETLVLGDRGGYVVPNSGGGGANVYVYVTSPSDPQQIANEVGWELRKLRRTG